MSTTDSSYMMFCGSYTNFDILAHLPNNDKVGKGVYCFHFHNGQIKPLTTIQSLNPAVLSFHPSDPNTVYILSEGIVDNGLISKIEYSISHKNKKQNSDIQLSLTENDPFHCRTNGKSLCYFKIDPISQRYGIAINYWEGSIDVYTIQNNRIGKLYKHIDRIAKSRRQVQNREDHWANRQVGSHSHSVHYYKEWVFIPDLGENAIFQYAFNPKRNVIMEYEAQLKLVNGNGPRHMVFHPKLAIAYVSNELSSSITVLAIDGTAAEVGKKKCRLRIMQHIHTHTKDMLEELDIYKKNYVAEIGISNDGRFVYCSNRGYDTIAVFRILKDGLLETVSYVSTFGKTPRHFSITPDDQYLIGANQDSNNLVVFARDLHTGMLTLVRTYNDLICAPNYVLFSPINVSEMMSAKKNGNVKENQSVESQKREHLFGPPTVFVFVSLLVVILCGILLL